MEEACAENNRALEATLEKIEREDTRATRGALYSAFVKSLLLVPTQTGEDGAAQRQGRRASPHLLQNSKGEFAIPVFTSTQAVELWKPTGCQCIELSGQKLAALSLQIEVNLLLINMAGPGAHGFLTRSELEMMAKNGRDENRLSKATSTREGREITLKIEAPTKPAPAKLLSFLKLNLKIEPLIRSAYLFEACYDGGDAHLVLGVEPKAEELKVQRWLEGMVSNVMPYLGSGEYMDFLVIDQVLAQKVREVTPPIWEA